MKKMSLRKSKKSLTYAKKNLILVKMIKMNLILMTMIKMNLNHTIKSDHCHYTGKFRGAVHNICNFRYETPKKISVVFHYGSTYDYHFIIKQLAKDFKGHLECLGENTEKYITSSVTS